MACLCSGLVRGKLGPELPQHGVQVQEPLLRGQELRSFWGEGRKLQQFVQRHPPHLASAPALAGPSGPGS